MLSSRRVNYGGFTLVEVLIAAMIGLLVISLAVGLFTSTQGRYSEVTESYELEQRVSELVEWLQDDLKQTSLASVVVYPNPDHKTEPPGLSFASAHPLDQTKQLELTQYGSAKWQKHVYYTLEPDPKQAEMSHLIRYELASSQVKPEPSVHLPSLTENSTSRRRVSNVLLSHGYEFEQDGSQGLVPQKKGKAVGGFHPAFLLSDGTTSNLNPNQRTELNTSMLVIGLNLAQPAEGGRWSGQEFQFRVRPRN